VRANGKGKFKGRTEIIEHEQEEELKYMKRRRIKEESKRQ
jgi:hypothetical protein